jgi:hypothetical protein
VSAERVHEQPPVGAPFLARTKRLLFGKPRATREIGDTLLSKTLALPIFSSDPISSVAYATEAAMAVLVAVSLSSLDLVFPISLGIAALLAIVVLSYAQGVRAYASSGGSYVFARENLGTLPALVAGAALLTDYVLTVAVSVAAGVFALTSAAPGLASHQLALALVFVAILTVGNLRGVRESGLLFAFPTYGFIVMLYLTLAIGIGKCAVGSCPVAEVPHPLAAGTGTITLFALLKAFSSGAAALTGVESISNGVTAFRRPQAQNAARTLYVMGAIAISLFVATSWLAVQMHARPSETASVLSQIARGSFPAGSPGSVGYYLVQAFTLAILVLAANTSYRFRLAALLSATASAEPVRQPRRPPCVLERDYRPRREPTGLLVTFRITSLIHLRDRRVHRVHPRAGRDGAALAQVEGAGVALACGAECARLGDDLRRDGRGRQHEVPRRCVDGDHRDSRADSRLLRGAAALPGRRQATPGEGAGGAREP